MNKYNAQSIMFLKHKRQTDTKFVILNSVKNTICRKGKIITEH